MKTLAIIGSRSFSNYGLLKDTVLTHFYDLDSEFHIFRSIVSGGADGCDKLAEVYAAEYRIPITVIRPDYLKHPPKVAPLIRNEEIVKAADFVLAFWTGAMKSGTANALRHAREHKKPTMIIYV